MGVGVSVGCGWGVGCGGKVWGVEVRCGVWMGGMSVGCGWGVGVGGGWGV